MNVHGDKEYAFKTTDTPQPKLFVSYSWTTPEHEQWGMDLAQRLSEDDVDVIIDKWALREGHDAHAFMEHMVTDPAITKVTDYFRLDANSLPQRDCGMRATARFLLARQSRRRTATLPT